MEYFTLFRTRHPGHEPVSSALTEPHHTRPLKSKLRFLLPWLIAGLGFLPAGQVKGQTFTNLYSFTTSFAGTNSGGTGPLAGLISSGDTLYGTAFRGGISGNGTVFKINTNGTGFTPLHVFTAISGPSPSTNSDGATPYSELVLSGNTLYGTASAGGNKGNGTVFRVNTDGTGFTNLHSFTATAGSLSTNSDGAAPYAGLILSGSTLFGTASGGGNKGNGTVFALNTDGTGFTNLHNFTVLNFNASFHNTNSDGAFPWAGLILSNNTLFGTALFGGTSANGTVFKVNTDGTGFTNLYSFPGTPNFTNSVGQFPYARLILSGNTLYGTAGGGGSIGFGTVFAINANGTGITNLHSFDGPDGQSPQASLVLSGNALYGTTYSGGSFNSGIMFAVNTNGTGFTNLHSFASFPSDGRVPQTGLILLDNILYGTAGGGGSAGNGTIFSLSLPPPPNQRPLVANPIPNQTNTYGSPFSFTFATNTFADPDAGQVLSYTASGLPPGIAFTPATRTFSGTNTTVGVYTVTVTATDNGTPNLSTNTTFQFVVNKAPLTISVDNFARAYGGYAYYSLNFSGLVFDDQSWMLDFSPYADSLADALSPVGMYPITVFGGTDSRYEIVLANGTLSVTNAPLLAKAASVCRGVGQTNPPLYGVLSGVIYPDNIAATYACAATPASPAGDYPVVPVLNNPDGRLTNYSVTFVNGTLTVESDAISPDFQVLHYFGFTNRIGGTAGELTEGSGGWLYGTGGGKNEMGVFRVQKDGTGFLVVRQFSNAEGAPAGSLIWTNGLLFGVSASEVWSMNQDGTGFVPLHTFGSITNDGVGAQVGLLAASDGMLYGTTGGGGTNGLGTIFRINPDGSGYEELHSFATAYAEGFLPSALIEGTNGLLYGTAQSGGPGGYYGDGTLFRLNKDGSGFIVLHSFTFGATDGAQPMSRLFQASDGILYGTARIGGSGYGGVLFSYNDETATYSVSKNFDSPYYGGLEGAEPIGSLIEGTNGMLYGTTSVGGPTSYGGTVFKVNKDGNNFSVIKQFGPVPDTYSPKYGLLLASDDGLYGATSSGGPSDLLFGGGIFRLNQDGSEYAVLYPFSLSGEDGRKSLATVREASDGMVYGTTFSGGTMDRGTVFRMNKDGNGYEVLHSFDFSGTNGRNPAAKVIEGSDGLIYGTTSGGGAAASGTVFRMNKDGTGFEIVHGFAGYPTDGSEPAGGLVEGADGLLYGTTRTGGSLFGGTLFVMQKNGSDFAILHEFDAGYPKCTLVQDTNGVLYGTTWGGGANSAGTIFSWNTNGTGFASIHSFDGSDGPFGPDAGLLLASDDSLYGTASGSGQGPGGLFKIQRDGTGYQVLHSFLANGLDGYSPFAAPTEGADGRIYGTTQSGGVFNNGTIFRLKKDGSSYCVFYSFPADVTAFDTKAAFFRGTDRSLYATVGGDLNFGFIYRLDFSFNRPPILANAIPDQTNTYGSALNYTFPTDTFADPDAGQTLSYSAGNLPPGIGFNGPTRTFTGTPTNVGLYAVNVITTDNGASPLSTNTSFQMTIAKADIVVGAGTQIRPYGQPNPTFTGILVGVTNGDNITASFTCPATITSPPGDYPIIPTLNDPETRLGNYTVTTNAGTLTVNGVTLAFDPVHGTPTFLWPTNAGAFLPEYADDLTPPVTWYPVTSGLTTNGPNIYLIVTPETAVGSRFYRLHQP